MLWRFVAFHSGKFLTSIYFLAAVLPGVAAAATASDLSFLEDDSLKSPCATRHAARPAGEGWRGRQGLYGGEGCGQKRTYCFGAVRQL